MKQTSLIALAVLISSIVPASASALTPKYKLVRIPVPHKYEIESVSLTDHGILVGEIRNGGETVNNPDNHGNSLAFTWRPGHLLRTLKVPKGYATACANDASPDGRTVVGTAILVNDGAWLSESDTAIIWRDRHIKTLDPPPGLTNSDASQIAPNGDIIGTCQTLEQPDMDQSKVQTFPCKWSPPSYTPVKLKNFPDNGDTDTSGYTPPNTPESFKKTVKFTAQDNAKDGTAVGSVQRSDDTVRAYIILASGVPFDLNKCLTHPLPHGKALTNAEQIGPHGWILANLGSTDETDSNVTGETVLLMPVK